MAIQVDSFILRGVRPLYVDGKGILWASSGNKIVRSEDQGKTFNFVAQYKREIVEYMVGVSRFSSRFFRIGFHAALPLQNGGILAIVRKRILRCSPGESEFNSVFDVHRGSRPLNICHVPNGGIFFGEYFTNPYRDEVHVYGSLDDGKTWDIVYTFSPGTIRHIHGIFYDEYRKGCWILTGDCGDECRIIFTNDNFKTLETVIAGNQKARAVSVIPLKDGLIIPTDTPQEQNLIQWLDPETGQLEERFRLPGSAFYTGQAGNYLLVSTIVEPSQVNLNNHAVLFFSNDEGHNWIELYRQKKDKWSLKYFQYGAFILPVGKNPESIIYVYGQALDKIDNHMLVCKL